MTRLIDADALPMSWQPDCNGNDTFVTRRDLEHAPTVCCAECVHMDDRVYRPGWGICDNWKLPRESSWFCGDFERRRP